MKYPIFSRIFLFLSSALFVISLFVRLIFSSWDQASLFYLIASVVCLAISFALDWKAYFAIFQMRGTRKGLHASRPLVITAVVLVLLNYATTFYPVKVDLSTDKIHSLSVLSKRVAKSFNDTVEIIYLYIPDAESRDAERAVHESIKRYQDENTNIKYSKYNVMDRPDLAQKFSLQSQEQALFMEYKGHRERFYKTDENSITQTLLRLSKGRKTIYFSVGHGEANLLENEKKAGLAHLKKEVERLFYDTQEINLNNEMLPETAAALIVISPQNPLTAKAQEKILNFYHQGGRVFIAYDPISTVNQPEFLSQFGVKILDGTVHMEENALAASGSHLVSGIIKDPENPIMQGLGSEAVVIFYITGALEAIPGTKSKVTPLVVSPATAILRAGLLKSDKAIAKGPFNLLVHVEDAGSKGQAFIADDGDLFTNQFLYQHLNPTLMFNMFSYLSKDEDIISETPPTGPVSNDFLVTEIQYKTYLGLFILPLPILLFAIGGFVWFRRRWL